MDKGIRAYARNYFAEQNALRLKGEVYTGPKANTAFRKSVMTKLMDEFGVTLASAATHYNEALISVRKTTPEAVQGLGRPEDKKGGRKRKETPAAAQEQVPEGATSDAAESNVLPSLGMSGVAETQQTDSAANEEQALAAA